MARGRVPDPRSVLLVEAEDELGLLALALDVDDDVPAVLERAEEQLVAERALHLLLDDARERARAVVLVVALLGQVVASPPASARS